VKTTTIQVSLKGIVPIMFNKFSGSLSETLQWRDKVHTLHTDHETIIIPSRNISNFLSSQLCDCAPKRVLGKNWKTIAAACLSYTTITPLEIPILRNKKRLTRDNSGMYLDSSIAKVKKSGGLIIPIPIERPVIPLDWDIEFDIHLFENKDLSETMLKTIFEGGGIAIGLGTYRGVYGKFIVKKWIPKDND
jgi:hypothetical protein